jgi:biopolymer transport protein ExbD
MKLKLPAADEDDEIDITPMIDCVFLLVLFFMVTSSFLDEPKEPPGPLSVVVPKTDGTPGSVTMSLHGNYLFRDRQEGETEDLDTALRRLREQGDGPPLRVRIQGEVQSVRESKLDDAHVLPLQLPTAANPTTIRRDAADIVTLGSDGTYRWNEAGAEQALKDVDELIARLKKRAGAARQRPVILRCDARCSYQQFIQAQNALKLAGVETVFLEVEVRHGKKP